MFPRLLSVLQWCLQFQLEMRAPTWHALYTFVTKSMPRPKTFPSAQLMGDNSGYNRPEQREEMETQFNQRNRHQPEMSQRLILQTDQQTDQGKGLCYLHTSLFCTV